MLLILIRECRSKNNFRTKLSKPERDSIRKKREKKEKVKMLDQHEVEDKDCSN